MKIGASSACSTSSTMPKDNAEKKAPRRRKQNRSRHDGEVKDRWDIMFDRLVEFKRRHGHCLVPNRYKEDRSLGSWVSTQRRQFKILTSGGSESTPMTPDRASRLMSIGFAWATKDPRHVPWETRFKELLEFKEKYGHCLVPVGFKENPKLSNWVSTQRQEKKLLKEGRSSRLTEERVKALEEVGFVWEAQRGGPRKKRGQQSTTPDQEDRKVLATSRNPQQASATNPMRGANSQSLENPFLPFTAPNRLVPAASILPPAYLPQGGSTRAFAQLPAHLRTSQPPSDFAINSLIPDRNEAAARLNQRAMEGALLRDAMERENMIMLRQREQELVLASQIQSLSQSSPYASTGIAAFNPGVESLANPQFATLPLANYPRHLSTGFHVDPFAALHLQRGLPTVEPERAQLTSPKNAKNYPGESFEEDQQWDFRKSG